MKKTLPIVIRWDISHFTSNTPSGYGLQIWQYVNGTGDGGFSCDSKDYEHSVAQSLGVGALALALNNQIYDYVTNNKVYHK